MRQRRGRRIAAAAVLVAIAAALAALAGRGSTSDHVSVVKGLQAKNAAAFQRAREQLHGGESEEAGGADAEAYADRAYPADSITLAQTQQAASDAKAVSVRHARGVINRTWNELGPSTLNVDRLGTQTYQRPTQWSGRTTALAIGSNCTVRRCPLYVGAAGGGVWRSLNALSATPIWKFVGGDVPSTAVGSLALDPNDPFDRTIYLGTGEANNSADSAAGLGLYKSTDDGEHWSLVPGSFAPALNHAISTVAIDPRDPKHILFGTGGGTRGAAANGGAQTAASTASRGLFESRDGGATFATLRSGATVNEVKFDPTNPNVFYAAIAGVGLQRSTGGVWETIFSGTRGRYTFATAALPNGKTRIYLADANGGGESSQAYRIDDASRPAATLTASSNAAWERLSSPVDGTPKYASYGYCDGQCTYDMYIASPAGRPDMVVLGGLMNYDELPPYGGPGTDRSNGRAVLLSTDGGETWTDQTGDAQSPGESIHPDEHFVAFVKNNPDTMFLASDGGVIRTSGTYTDASSQCDSAARGLSGVFLTDCKAWLKRIPTRLEPVNAGLATLQMQSIAVNPFNANEALAGTQDNGSISFSGSPWWRLGLTGDGADAGFDAVNPQTRFHTYYTGWLDVNFQGDKPETWLWIGDPLFFNPDGVSFYPPTLQDPVRGGAIFMGARHVWRTQDSGGDRAFLEAHCNTTNQFGTSDLLFTGQCGDFVQIGGAVLTGTAYGTTKQGGTTAALGRGNDAGTLWAATSVGRVLISRNANDPAANVTFTRIDTPAQPGRFPSSVTVDPSNPLHAIVTYSGYDSNTPATPGHVFDVVYDPGTGTATWTNISYDFGDQPVLDSVFDDATGDVYVSTDFGVDRLVQGTTTWVQAADGMPFVSVPSLTLFAGKNHGTRYLYAATHGRGAFRVSLSD